MTSTKVTPYTYLVQRCAPLLSAVSYVWLLVLVAPLTKLTTLWLDNIMDGVTNSFLLYCYELFSSLTCVVHAFYSSFSFMIYMHHPQG